MLPRRAADWYAIPLFNAAISTPIKIQCDGTLHDLRSNSADWPFHELQHAINDTFPQWLGTDLCTGKIIQRQQPPDPLIRNLTHMNSRPSIILTVHAHRATGI